MVRRSSVRNVAVGITGMLWFDGVNFAQVLEGEHDHISGTMDRIRQDNRHIDLAVVIDCQTRGREFGSWGMVLADDGAAGVEGTALLLGLLVSVQGDSARRLHDVVTACEI